MGTALNWLSWLNAHMGIGGAAVTGALVWIASIRGWLGTPAGQATLDDAEKILPAALDIIAVNFPTHAASPSVSAGLTTIIEDAKKLATLPPASPASPASGVGAGPKALLLFLGLAALAGTAHAGWLVGPGVWTGVGGYQAGGNSLLDPVATKAGGLDVNYYYGTWNNNVFTPTFYAGLIGGDNTVGTLNQFGLGGQVGYQIPSTAGTGGAGVFALKPVSNGGATGLIFGICGQLQFSGWIPGVYWGAPGN